jgi:UDP-2,3-diacylglucosamine hydrolase
MTIPPLAEFDGKGRPAVGPDAHQQCLGILACGGSMPAAVCEAAIAQGRRVHVVALEGITDPAVERFPHDWVRLGQLQRLLNVLRRAGCKDLVLIGSMSRPNLRKVGFDAGFLWHARTILGLTRGGDDSVLSRVVRFFEDQGFRVRGAHEIAPVLLAPEGLLGGVAPDGEACGDIACGLALLAALAPFDVGQSVVVARGHVLAIEAAEGTDAMLERCRAVGRWGGGKRAGVLVKAPKRGQELRVDMPVVGPRTVELAALAGLTGIAVAAGQVMIAEQAAMIDFADRNDLFVIGAGPAASAVA